MESRMNRATFVALLFVGIGTLVAIMMAASSWSVSAAPTDEDLSGSTLTVNQSEALQGATVQYTLNISNSGTSIANPLMMTATIPTGASYVDGTFSVDDSSNTASGTLNETAQEITWDAVMSPNGYALVTFDVEIDAATALSTVLTTTVMLDAANGGYTLTATTTVVEQTDSLVYMPLMMFPGIAPETSASAIAASGTNYQWTVSWTSEMSSGPYEIEESQDADFSTILSTRSVTTLSQSYTHAPSNNNTYYYRVRWVGGASSDWSNIVSVVNAYRDDFDNSTSGWLKVRQDLDDTQNELSYTAAGYLKMWVRGRWDYFVSSPLKPTPAGDYSLSSRVKYDGAGNLNTYGFIVGADWNGDQCPTLIANPNPTSSVNSAEIFLDPSEQEESHIFGGSDGGARVEMDVDNCFNHYYRVMLMWFGSGSLYKLQVKRIDFHESPKNSGRGPELLFFDVPIGDQNDWNDWRLEVRRSTGDFALFSNGTQVATWNDSTFINDVWWGLWASTDEYPGSDPLYDYVEVKPLP